MMKLIQVNTSLWLFGPVVKEIMLEAIIQLKAFMDIMVCHIAGSTEPQVAVIVS